MIRTEPVVYLARPLLLGNDLGYDIEMPTREESIDRIRIALIGEHAAADAGYIHCVDAEHAEAIAEVAYDALVGAR